MRSYRKMNVNEAQQPTQPLTESVAFIALRRSTTTTSESSSHATSSFAGFRALAGKMADPVARVANAAGIPAGARPTSIGAFPGEMPALVAIVAITIAPTTRGKHGYPGGIASLGSARRAGFGAIAGQVTRLLTFETVAGDNATTTARGTIARDVPALMASVTSAIHSFTLLPHSPSSHTRDRSTSIHS